MHAANAIALTLSIAAPALAQQPGAPAKPAEIVGFSAVSAPREVTADIDLADGRRVTISFKKNEVSIGGVEVGKYAEGGPLETSWRGLIEKGNATGPADFSKALKGWQVSTADSQEAKAKAAIADALAGLALPSATLSVTASRPVEPSGVMSRQQRGVRVRSGDDTDTAIEEIADLLDNGSLSLKDSKIQFGNYTLDQGQSVDGSLVVLRGSAAIDGHVKGTLVVYGGDVALGDDARIDGDVVAINGKVARDKAVVGGAVKLRRMGGDLAPRSGASVVVSRTLGLLGALLALACIGFGLSYFMPKQVEIVSDTVSQSFVRSFLAGLLAQPLVLPVLATIIIALTLSIVGILVVPVAVIAFIVTLTIAVLGGYVAAARSVGQFAVRQRVQIGKSISGELGELGYVVVGLVALLAIWAPAALLGWIPLVGSVILWAAIVFTWAVVTAGFGAVLLANREIRDSFAAQRRGNLTSGALTPRYSAGARERAGRE